MSLPRAVLTWLGTMESVNKIYMNNPTLCRFCVRNETITNTELAVSKPLTGQLDHSVHPLHQLNEITR